MEDQGIKAEDPNGDCAIATTPRSDTSGSSPILGMKRPIAQSFGSYAISAKNTVTDSLLSEIDSDLAKSSKKKRRIFSCDSCRKLKTKCDYSPGEGSCKRCHRLRLDCSLASESGIRQEVETTPVSTRDDSRLSRIEQTVDSFNGKLSSLLELVKQSLGSGNQLDFSVSPENELLSNYDVLAPLNVIKQIDSKLFHRPNKRDPFKRACDQFLKFYFQKEQLCLELSRSFLEISHFWIIPGGITSIDRKYVLDHPFITCVFVILAMCFDENYKYVDEQNELYMLTTKLLGVALVTEPLSDHDIEAILYISLYNIARKPKQSEFDSWLLSSIGLKHLMISIDFKNLSHRVSMNIFNADDLFHLRIFNSMCSCHFQSSIGYGRPIMLTSTYLELRDLTLKFPKATFGDAIKVAEIELYLLLSRGLADSSLAYSLKNDLLYYSEFNDWQEQWSKIIQKDVSQMLTFAYNFAHIMLARKAAQKSESNGPDPLICYNTACHYSFETLNRFLLLSNSLVKGSPSFQLNQVVYSSITLCDYMEVMKPNERRTSLNLISKVYWHLNKVGEKMNDATDTIAKIIHKLVDTANNAQFPKSTPHKLSQNRERLSVAALPKSVTDQLYSPPKPQTEIEEYEFKLPDVADFDNFEDFFRGLFDK
ncbi:hypothetical protein OGAPHI_007296 [Ogataea philodendri]|uniref:Zn(2)-C6 fungal-type domain-containing protein n=1 Tax=Ogataea philodendri TaxID=1378263 RepID=A0A9P8SZ67_9ASCO|nr:uncharacterized protein OGAPHI_007296 [Ogataea philodendri]KAH3660091.1 hypothetical protein OGAPHI_007296 [Ogataea philodendri]